MAELEIRPTDMARAVAKWTDAAVNAENGRACREALVTWCETHRRDTARYEIRARNDARSRWFSYRQ